MKKIIEISPFGIINEKNVGISYKDAIKKYGYNRFTLNNLPERAKKADANGMYPLPEFKDDTDWYLHTLFPEDIACGVDEIYQKHFLEYVSIVKIKIGPTFPFNQEKQDFCYNPKDYIHAVFLDLTSENAKHNIEILFDELPNYPFGHIYDLKEKLKTGLDLSLLANDFPNIKLKMENANIDPFCVTGDYSSKYYYGNHIQSDLPIRALDYIMNANQNEQQINAFKM